MEFHSLCLVTQKGFNDEKEISETYSWQQLDIVEFIFNFYIIDFIKKGND